MPFRIVRNDITHMKADAIVNAANEHLWQGGGVCGAIFTAAGAKKMQKACDKIGHCDTGKAVATPAFALSAKYVIHTVGPVWRGGTHGDTELLASCYRSSLELAESLGCTSIAFPLISAGIYGFPRREALRIAQDEIRAFLDEHEMDITLVLYDKDSMVLADDLRLRVASYIDDVYVDAHAPQSARRRWETEQQPWVSTSALPDWLNVGESVVAEPTVSEGVAFAPETPAKRTCPCCGSPIEQDAAFCINCGHDLREALSLSETDAFPSFDAMAAPTSARESAYADSAPQPLAAPFAAPAPAPRESAKHKVTGVNLPNPLRNLLDHLDASFSETLLALIDERGLKDSQVYKRANISRQHFSKMRSNPRYKPTKTTVLALAVALQLSLEETAMLLERAGFALSHADRRDVIVEFFIRSGDYDIFKINDVLFAYDQPLLA